MVFTPSLGYAGLTGADREDFVEAVFQSCFQANDAKNKGYSLSDLARYCSCYSNALADRMTPEEVERFNETSDLTIVKRPASEAAGKCNR